MEQLFVTRGIGNLAADVDVMCPPPGRSFERHQCLHGVGHGVMAWTAYELEDALELCERLGDESGRASCFTGVFMENVASGLSGPGGQASTYVDWTDPHYPCNALDQRYVPHCYWYQTSQMLRVFNHDLTLVAQACREAPLAARRLCFGSYGRGVAGTHRLSPHRVVQFCDQAPNSLFRSDCIDGAVRTLFWDPTEQAEGFDLCAMVEERVVAETCHESLVAQAHSVLPAADMEVFCVKLPDRWRDRCRRVPRRP